MVYRFAVADQDYGDYAGGRVFYSQPGQPAFPVRLASEIWQRCLAHWGGQRPFTLYDPCCGGAYHLAVLAHLHGSDIGTIIASDVDEAVLSLAERNLGLASLAGLDGRIAELTHLQETYDKQAHTEAIASATRLRQQWQQQTITTHLFCADVMDKDAVMAGMNGRRADIVLTDVPYGWLSDWQTTTNTDHAPIWRLLESLHPVLAENAIVAIATDKRQKVAHEAYGRLEKFQVGKRRVWLGRPL
jgi:hypothetical protein